MKLKTLRAPIAAIAIAAIASQPLQAQSSQMQAAELTQLKKLKHLNPKMVPANHYLQQVRGTQAMTPAAVGGALAGYVAEKVVEATFKMYRSEKSLDDLRGTTLLTPHEEAFDIPESLKQVHISQWSDQELDDVIDRLDGVENTVALVQRDNSATRYLTPVQVDLLKKYSNLSHDQKRAVIRAQEANFLTAIAAGAAAGAAIGAARELIRYVTGSDQSAIKFNEDYFDLKDYQKIKTVNSY